MSGTALESTAGLCTAACLAMTRLVRPLMRWSFRHCRSAGMGRPESSSSALQKCKRTSSATKNGPRRKLYYEDDQVFLLLRVAHTQRELAVLKLMQKRQAATRAREQLLTYRGISAKVFGFPSETFSHQVSN